MAKLDGFVTDILRNHANDEEVRRLVFDILCPRPKGPPRAYYFGCRGGSGHYLWTERGAHADERSFPFTKVVRDQTVKSLYLAPGKPPMGGQDAIPYEQQVQGLFTHQYRDGWTAISTWDRTVDERYGCVSTFIAEGMHTFGEMLGIACSRFPWVIERFAKANIPLNLAPDGFGDGT